MSYDLPCVSYMALYIVSMHILNTNSRTSTHWKLNAESGKVQAAMAASGEGDSDGIFEDPLMSILTSKVTLDNGEWRLDARPVCSHDCQRREKQGQVDNNEETSTDKLSNDHNKCVYCLFMSSVKF